MGGVDETGPEPAVPDESGADAAAPESAAADTGITDAEIASLIDEQSAADAAPQGAMVADISEEAVVALIAERDDYLDQLQRAKAEFANAKRRSDERAETQRAQAATSLVEKLLPVLDSCDAALAQGIEEVRPVCDALFDVLSAQGLERVDAIGEAFDPELHEAVLYEAGEGEQVVIETLRTGYRWKERVLRAPMVKVQG